MGIKCSTSEDREYCSRELYFGLPRTWLPSRVLQKRRLFAYVRGRRIRMAVFGQALLNSAEFVMLLATFSRFSSLNPNLLKNAGAVVVSKNKFCSFLFFASPIIWLAIEVP